MAETQEQTDGPLERSPNRRNGVRVRPAQRARFIQAIAEGLTGREAAELAGINYRYAYRIRDRDPAFAEAWKQAYDAGTDLVRAEIRRRGLEGFDEDTFDGDGNLIRRVHRFSDQALLAEAKRRDPAYRDNQKLELSGTAHVEVKHSVDPTVVLERLAAAGVIQLGPAEPGDPQVVVDAGRRALLPARSD